MKLEELLDIVGFKYHIKNTDHNSRYHVIYKGYDYIIYPTNTTNFLLMYFNTSIYNSSHRINLNEHELIVFIKKEFSSKLRRYKISRLWV